MLITCKISPKTDYKRVKRINGVYDQTLDDPKDVKTQLFIVWIWEKNALQCNETTYHNPNSQTACQNNNPMWKVTPHLHEHINILLA
jgi:hypothetical protein